MASPKNGVKVGIHLPETERLVPWQEYREMAIAAEEAGFDSVWIPDHLLYRYEGQAPDGPWECWTLMAAIAAVTTRVEFGPLVLCTAFRNPALTAKMAATIDEISGGRFILGLGAGWHQPEFEAFGFPYDHRFSRFKEALEIIHPLLREGKVDYQGAFYGAPDCEIIPRGPRPGGVPIMLGTMGDKMLELTARYADQWNGWGQWFENQPEKLAGLLDKVDAACRAAGRDPATLERTATLLVNLPGHEPDTQFNRLGGSLDDMAAAIRACLDLGVAHVQILLHPNTVEAISAFAPVLEMIDGR